MKSKIDEKIFREFLKENIRNYISSVKTSPYDEDFISSMSMKFSPSERDKRLVQHFTKNHGDEFFSELEELVKKGVLEDRAMVLIARNLSKKYGGPQ
jgi:hypothetical protein